MIEAVSVGVFLMFVLLILYAIGVNMTTPGAIAIIGFAVGAGSHLFFEATGVNHWYCKHGCACKTSGEQ